MKKHPDFERIRPWLWLVAFALIGLAVVLHLDVAMEYTGWIISLFNPLIYGGFIAFILNVPMRFIENKLNRWIQKGFLKKKVRLISLLITLILAVLVIALLSWIVFPKILESLMNVVNNVSVLLCNFFENFSDILAYFHVNIDLFDVKQVEKLLSMPWQDMLNQIVSWVGNSANGIVSTTVAFGNTFAVWFTGFMFSLYILTSKETLALQFRKVVTVCFKDKAESICQIGVRANKIFSSFISGQLCEAIILGCLYLIGMKLFKMPFAELISTIIAVSSLVPVFGAMFGMMIGAFLIFTVNPWMALGFVVFYQVLQEVENNLIYPRVVGSSVGLPGLWTLLSIFVFGGMFGVLGMLMAVPTCALVYSLFSEFINTRYRKFMQGELAQQDKKMI